MAAAEGEKARILFVCMGNICRSPTAHGLMLERVREAGMASRIEVDSAGTHAYHVGAGADERARMTAARRRISLDFHRARRVAPTDFEVCDYIVAMDEENRQDLIAMAPRPEHRDKISLMLEYAPRLGVREVPDPYYGGESGFERVFDLLEAAAEGLLEHVRQTLPRRGRT